MSKDFSKNVGVTSLDVAESLFSGSKAYEGKVEKKKVMLRMDPDLYDILVKEAKAEHRSLNSYILHILDNRNH